MSRHAVVALIGVAGCNWIGVQGSGHARAEVRNTPAFSAVSVDGSIDADIAIGPGSRVELTGDDNIVPLITTEVHGDRLVFMHAVKDGPADRSFGLQVAALAGLPRSVVAQAKRTLAELEARAALHGETMTPAALDAPRQMGLFAPPPNALLDALEELDPDQLTPRQAHEALYRLRALLRN